MKTAVRAADLAGLLKSAPSGLQYLSLDCFDTLLWRNVQAPQDVFADLPLPGGGVWPRVRAESSARRLAKLDAGRAEVSIEEIYRNLLPAASLEALAEAVDRELAAEARHCFGFAPTVALMEDARRRGLRIILVSDTYLSEAQLRSLIELTAGPEVAGMIDRIFCSSAYGMPKAAGLFNHVLRELAVPPWAILHVGDNIRADQDAPHALGISTVHFRQFDPACEQRLRFEAAAAAMLDSATRNSVPSYQPHRPQVSLRSTEDPVWSLGYDVLGPLMHAFASWVRQEADEMEERLGRPVKLLFVLRDGYLPRRVFDAVFGDDGASRAIEISRFTARRAGFHDAAMVRKYLGSQGNHARIDVLARQLGLSKEEGAKLAKGAPTGGHQSAFNKAALSPNVLAKIVSRSAGFADRLAAHLRKAGAETGDAVMLVDLGYNGTVQNLIEPILRDRMNLTVAGRYLLLREEDRSGLDKRGLLDVRHLDNAALNALCGPIALVEQLCTVAQGSVVDYAPDGEPLRKAAGVKSLQSDIRDRIQEACVVFAGEATHGVLRAPQSDDADARRRMAAAVLARLLFMPLASEIEIFKTFNHDVNLGTNDLIKLLDVEDSAMGLRRRGLSYLNDANRMYLPGELQPHGLPLNLSLFSVNRFGLDLRSGDFQTSTARLPVIVADNRAQTIIGVDAHPTHDGYYLATIPVGAGRLAAGVQFGALFEWVQVEEAGFYPVESFGSGPDKPKAKAVPAQLLCEGMEEESPGFYRCSPEALMLAPPPNGVGDVPHLLAIVFRPLVWRQASQFRKAA